MNIKNVFATMGSLIPFWASSLIKYFGIGNEYTMLINVILQQIMQPLEYYITETLLYYVIAICCILVICYENNLIDSSMFKFNDKRTLTITGNEKNDVIDYCESMNALTKCFIEEYNYNDIMISKNTKIHVMLKNIKNKKLKNDLYLDITRNENKVIYSLTSYNINLDKFVINATKKYNLMQDKKYVHLYGTETETTYNYSTTLISLSYTLVHKYGLNNLINKMLENENGNGNGNGNEKGNNKKYSRDEKINIEKKTKMIFLIDEYNNYKLEEDIYISITRMNEIVKFSLYSSTQNLIEFLDKCDTFYKINFNISKFNYRLIIQGYETGDISSSINKMSYSKELMAINYHLIFVHKYKNYRKIENHSIKMTKNDLYMKSEKEKDCENEIANMFKYVIEDIGSIEFEGITMSIKRYNHGSYGVTVDYILESDTVDLEFFVNDLTRKYDKMNKEKNKNKLYHFTLNSIENDCPKFSTELIYDKEPLLFENFDNISSVHNDFLINDMNMLKDIEYYKRTGMKRKKSYLFYGEPGCGKTSSIIAMGMYDKRHIIEIPMALILTNQDLDAIMNLQEIEDISFKNDEIIILFDEIDIGMNCNLKNQQLQKNTNDDLLNVIVTEMQNKDNDDKTKLSKNCTRNQTVINIGTLLSKFDGISNYNGKIIIATTNNKDKINPAICRPQRLTPIYFTYCRKIDIESIINKFFTNQKFILDFDLKITPAKLTFLCETHNHDDINILINHLKQNC